MALNPTAYTENVIGNFLKYQLTTYAFADPDLHEQMRKLLSLEETRRTPLMKGPYFSLSRSFAKGASVRDMVSEGVLHPHMANLIPYPHIFAHQESAIREITSGKTTLISTGTGSGKTECFLYPIISRCLELRDRKAGPGIVAVIVYPMNALAEDQLDRLRDLLAGSGITFGLYVGTTPESESGVTGVRMDQGCSREDYRAKLAKAREENRAEAVHPLEERCSREKMRTPGEQPRILLTNVKQMELLLTRFKDVELFAGAQLDYLVFDEAHTFSGANGAETACLIRRLRAFCGREASETVCIATSATIADREEPDTARKFASRFFGVPAKEVSLVLEQYQDDRWASVRTVPPPLAGDSVALLYETLRAVDAEDSAAAVSAICGKVMGQTLPVEGWQEALYERLTVNEVVYILAEVLKTPQPLAELLDILERRAGRRVPEEELLIWLTLGAAARLEDRALLRPVVHAFVQGVGGAVVTFPEGVERPRLWLSVEQEERHGDPDELIRLPILTCNKCAQHYFEAWAMDFQFSDKSPMGGEAVGNHSFWPHLEKAQGGSRVILLDRLAGSGEDGEDDDEPQATAAVFLCRGCGALYPEERDLCNGCGRSGALVRLLAVQNSIKQPGKIGKCVSCGARGRFLFGSWREPIRPVRATTVADVYVLSQEMIRHAERSRLLVFADNRQDAAFQAGWMGDHARRYRLRGLMWELIREGRISIGDLVAHLDERLDRDDALSKALLPEVWLIEYKTRTGHRHQEHRKYYLRLKVLLELTMSLKERTGLEPWGRMKVDYHGLDVSDAFIQEKSKSIGTTPELLLSGIKCLLDIYRRQMILLDRSAKEPFTHIWMDGDWERSRGFLPEMRGVPKGLKLERGSGDDKSRIVQWLSPRNAVYHSVISWGVPSDNAAVFVTDLWKYLTGKKILVRATLRGSKGRELPQCPDTWQIDADMLYVVPGAGVWQCRKCRRAYARPLPNNKCPNLRCDGDLVEVAEREENYDLELLDATFQMLRAREHSAQVPHEDREYLEREFKGEGDAINTLVCTPTLELGVDIGALDAILMRNVPPRPANYWQRAGRAGRRHRMAVDVTYARPASHDRFFFAEPLKMLEGRVEPPRFNLQNEVMVRKHVHASVLTRLHKLAHERSGLPESERRVIEDALRIAFPHTIRDYLFEDNQVREQALDVSPLNLVIRAREDDLVEHVRRAFEQGWPEEDARVVEEASIRRDIQEMTDNLQLVVDTLKKRLNWALNHEARLDIKRRRDGSLKPEEDALYARCDRLIKRYKGELKRRKGEAEGYDDTVTFGVLASEGFLPGYGLESGSIIGNANTPKHMRDLKDFDLPRPPAIALREYVPGNLIYANGHRFVARYHHLEPGDPVPYGVDVNHEAVWELSVVSGEGTSVGALGLRAVPICDVDLAHVSNISDEEEYRFQMPVATYGYELERHNGGMAYSWGSKTLQFRRGVHLRLVNVGSSLGVGQGSLGFPVCLVCGQSRSPWSSTTERQRFEKDHQDRCGKPVESTGFYANIVADSITIKDCEDRKVAYSLLEALRVGAERVLDMERDDLQVLVIGRSGTDLVDALFYDPMPGGSGLLQQVIERFDEVYVAAVDIVSHCPEECASACNECLCTYWNAFYHRHLDRNLAVTCLQEWGESILPSHDIPALLPKNADPNSSLTVNVAEETLKGMLDRAGFAPAEWHHQIHLGHPLGSTSPDCFYPGEDEDEPGLCIYLDGLSRHIHGNAETAERDAQIRGQLRSMGYDVIEIAVSELTDRNAMTRYFYRMGKILVGKDKAVQIKADPRWFATPSGE